MLLPLVLLALCFLLAGCVAVLGMLLPGRPEPWRRHLLLRLAWLAAAGAAAVYLSGLADVALSEHAFGNGADSVPAPACRDGIAPEVRAGLSRHRASYLPLAFDCVREDGSSYPANPAYAWMNPVSAGLGLAAAGLVTGAWYATGFRGRGGAAR